MSSTKVLVASTNGIVNDGITSWIISIFKAMDLSGFDVSTIGFEDDCTPDVQRAVEDAGIRVFTTPNRRSAFRGYASKYRQILDACGFDIVHVCCNSALATFELREAKKRVVGMRIAHSHNTMCTHRVVDKVLRPFFYQEATDYYACGRDAGKWLFGNRSFTIIPNGKELGDWSFSPSERDSYRSRLGVGPSDVVIGHVGGFNEQKNHAKLLSVFSELHKRSDKYRLVLVGDGGLMEQTKALARRLDIEDSVLFLGRRGDVSHLLNAMDCMVLPSLYEGFPNVVLEWQLSGLPCVMSDVVTDDVAITPLVTQMPLGAADVEWADAIESSLVQRSRASDSVMAMGAAKAQGYDIHDDAALLRRLYLEGVARCH